MLLLGMGAASITLLITCIPGRPRLPPLPMPYCGLGLVEGAGDSCNSSRYLTLALARPMGVGRSHSDGDALLKGFRGTPLGMAPGQQRWTPEPFT